jgi:hypothetical protein
MSLLSHYTTRIITCTFQASPRKEDVHAKDVHDSVEYLCTFEVSPRKKYVPDVDMTMKQ